MWARELNIAVGSQNNYASKNKSIMRGLAYHRKIYKLLTNWQRISAPEQQLYIEPWLRHVKTKKLRQPDAVLVDPLTNTAIVIEVKMNWKDGRDEKLVNEYLDCVLSAFDVSMCWPCVITGNVAGLKHEPRLGLGSLLGCDDWRPGSPTPVVLVP